MKVTITSISRKNVNKDGQPYLDRNGRPYWLISIQTQEHGKQYLSGFGYEGEPQMAWKGGDVVDIEIQTKGKYVNFRVPKTQAQPVQTSQAKESDFSLQLEDIQKDISGLIKAVDEIKELLMR